MAEYVRQVPQARRTTRTHGERKQDRDARRQFEYQQAQAPVLLDEVVVVTASGEWWKMSRAEYDRRFDTVGEYYAQEKRREK